MSVARRGGSGAASASLYWSLKQRVQYAFDSSIRGGCCFLDERVRRASCWAAAARENAKPDRHSHRDGRKLKPHGPLLSRNLNTLTCIGVPTRAKIFWPGLVR